ncbi:MAG: hypothetical protein ACYTG5_07610 [Planctomycetota bacterium]
MKAARRWLYAAALLSFAAGVSVGVVLPRLLSSVEAGQDPDSTDDEDYIRKLTELCDLDSQQIRDLRMILVKHERELQQLRRTYFDHFPPIYREKYDMAGKRMDTRIRGILDSTQEDEYLAISGQREK